MRMIVLSALLLSATATQADTVKVAETDDTAYYVDPATVVVEDALRRVSVVHDYPKRAPGGVRSRSVSYEVDCAAERLRSVAVADYAEPMARGPAASSYQRESAWLYVGSGTGSNIAKRTPYRAIVKLVCARER